MFFFFNDTATTEIYTLPLHDALPISPPRRHPGRSRQHRTRRARARRWRAASQRKQDWRARCLRASDRRRPRRNNSGRDRKSTRLNSSHLVISYAVFCLKKKKNSRACDAFTCPCRDETITSWLIAHATPSCPLGLESSPETATHARAANHTHSDHTAPPD